MHQSTESVSQAALAPGRQQQSPRSRTSLKRKASEYSQCPRQPRFLWDLEPWSSTRSSLS